MLSLEENDAAVLQQQALVVICHRYITKPEEFETSLRFDLELWKKKIKTVIPLK